MRERVSKQSAAEAEEAEAEVVKKGKAERHRESTQRVVKTRARYTALLVLSLLCTGSCRPCCVAGLSVATTGRERREGGKW